MSARTLRPGARVRLKRNAPHVPAHHAGDVAQVVGQKALTFGTWYRVRFDDGCEMWTLPERVVEQEEAAR